MTLINLGDIQLYGYKLSAEEDNIVDSKTIKFRSKEKIIESYTNLQLPISTIKFFFDNKV